MYSEVTHCWRWSSVEHEVRKVCLQWWNYSNLPHVFLDTASGLRTSTSCAANFYFNTFRHGQACHSLVHDSSWIASKFQWHCGVDCGTVCSIEKVGSISTLCVFGRHRRCSQTGLPPLWMNGKTCVFAAVSECSTVNFWTFQMLLDWKLKLWQWNKSLIGACDVLRMLRSQCKLIGSFCTSCDWCQFGH